MDGTVLSFLSAAATPAPQAVSAANPLPVTFGSGPLAAQVQGNSAAGVADVGFPVKIGGVFNTALPTLANGQRGDAQMDANSILMARLMGQSASGSDGISNTLAWVSNGGTTRLLAIANTVLNGSGTWDRQLGSAADGTITKPFAFRTNDLQNALAFAAAGTLTMFPTAGAGIKNFVTGLQLSSGTGAAETLVQVMDGSTMIWKTTIEPGQQMAVVFQTPLQGSANTVINIVTSVAAGAVLMNVMAQGYKG